MVLRVILITIIIIIILAGITINAVVGDNGLIYQARSSKDMSSNEIAETEGNMNNLFDEYTNVMSEDSEIPIDNIFKPQQTPKPEDGGIEFEMSFGVIEIKWLNGVSNYVSKEPNEPKVKNISNGIMELVKYDQNSKTWIKGAEYNYVAGIGTVDNNISKWANARVTIDGIESYFVWIPRYAYRIIYFKDETSKEEYKNGIITEEQSKEEGKLVGYSDSRGIVDKDGKKIDSATSDSNTTRIMVSEDYFMVHPAFTADVENGGWTEELEGIWIGKYEASRSTATASSGGSGTTTIKIQPGVLSWTNITIGNMYTNARNYNEELKSHMLKNSEWGVVAYLAESCYGRNGNEIAANSKGYVTGGGSGTSYVDNNKFQSTTGNEYGIYDLIGGAYEYVAGYYVESNSLNNGASFASGISDGYSTSYNGSSFSSGYKIGDATYETIGWHSDDAGFVNNNSAFFYRGGSYSATALTSLGGIFAFQVSNGINNVYGSQGGFRLAIIV